MKRKVAIYCFLFVLWQVNAMAQTIALALIKQNFWNI